jgi:DNA-formamidopyrimidine glycosylase
MPEGHTVQRTANWFNQHLKGQKIKVDSPQGRFSEDAKKINNRVLVNARAIGKQLFLDFDNDLTCRIHLGIYGKWRYSTPFHKEIVGEVRARFYTKDALADLRGPTYCQVIASEENSHLERKLGPDPTNSDAKKLNQNRFIARVRNSRSPIGILLMNQSVVSGIGNVYRAELLFRAKINPHTLGQDLSVSQLTAIWLDAVKLMKIGVLKGVMVTRQEQLDQRSISSERNYVYKREGLKCFRCKGTVVIEVMASRKLYWCPGCQN